MIKIKNIPHIAIVVLSMLYSVYVVANYLAIHLPLAVAIASSVVLSGLSHYYLLYSISNLKGAKQLHPSVFIAIILLGSIVFMEFYGLGEITKERLVNTEQLTSNKQLLNQLSQQLASIGTSKRWQDIESKRILAKQVQQLRKEIEQESKTVENQLAQAKEKANQFRVISLVLIILSLLASACIDEGKQTVRQPVSIPVSEPVIQPVSQTSLFKVSKPVDTVYNLSPEERIQLCSEEIIQTGQSASNKLTSKYKLSFEQLGVARKLARQQSINEENEQSKTPETGQQTIGF